MTLQQAFDFAPRPKPAETAEAPGARRNIVIEAGAGTGKTTAIVAEVLKLMLANEELAPERIVLMTFTEKAAGEIADRIRAALEELSELLSGVGYQVSGVSRPGEKPQTPDTRHHSQPQCESSSAGTLPPFSARLRITSLCSHMFIFAESSVSPV